MHAFRQLVVIFGLLAGTFAATMLAAADRPPNVLMIVSDDQAWNDYSFMDHPEIRTPHLDRLASQSQLYTRGYVPSSLCRPSLMTMITGLYPHQHRVVGNDPPKGTDRNAMLKHVRQSKTLPRLLGERGYKSLQTGKWWEGNFRDAGFTHGMTHGDPQRRGRHGDEGLLIGREGLQPIAKFLDECGDSPFFIWYAPMLPHTPHNPPARLFNKYKDKVESPHVARYYAMCEWFDETCGELLAMLDQRSLSDDTLVVYVTDNGWIQNPDSPQFAPRSKRSPYDGGLRTPILLRWPGRIKPMRDDSSLVGSIDLAPTILAACGITPPQDLPGVNLLQQLRDPHDILFGAIYEHDVTNIDVPSASLLFRWCVTPQWKLILPHGEASPELYKIQTDPWEKTNLATENEAVTERLVDQLNDWWAVQGK